MSLKRNSINLRDENSLINKIETENFIRATSSNIFYKNVFKTNTKTNYFYTTITTELLRQRKLNL